MFLSNKAPINWFKVYPYKQPNKKPKNNTKVTVILNIVDTFVIDFLSQLNKIYTALLAP